MENLNQYIKESLVNHKIKNKITSKDSLLKYSVYGTIWKSGYGQETRKTWILATSDNPNKLGIDPSKNTGNIEDRQLFNDYKIQFEELSGHDLGIKENYIWDISWFDNGLIGEGFFKINKEKSIFYDGIDIK